MNRLVALLLSLAACAPITSGRKLGPDLTNRAVCGWDEVSDGAARIDIDRDGKATPTPLGARVLVVDSHPDATFGQVMRALEPVDATLVRLKIVVGERWLIPMTHHEPQAVAMPKPAEQVVRIVGYRRITRRKGAPADRFADLRLDGARVELFVENEAQRGQQLQLAALTETLRTIQPPVGVFALSVSDKTRWRQVRDAVVAAACFDRGPGDEPHEVIFE